MAIVDVSPMTMLGALVVSGVASMNITDVFIIVATVLILLFDVYVYVKGQATLTQRMIKWSKYFMMIPFAWGFLMGHWFG